MHIIVVSSEVAPYAATGSLGQFVGQLAEGLCAVGAQVTVIAPFYRDVDPARHGLALRIRKLLVPMGTGPAAEVAMLDGKFRSCAARVILLDHPHSFQRKGIYGEAGADYADNYRRFHLLCAAALRAAADLELKPDVWHLHDWPTGSLPLQMAARAAELPGAVAPVVFTVHNPAFSGVFPSEILGELGLGYDHFNPDGVEFHGQVSLLKAGLVLSDALTTHGPTQVEEMQTESLGFGLHGLFRALGPKLTAVVPGVDTDGWDPGRDHRLAGTFSADDPAGKEACKEALQRALGLAVDPSVPLVVMLAPLTGDGGAHIALDAAARLPAERVQMAFLGATDPDVADRLATVTAESPRWRAHSTKLDEDTTRRALAGADALLRPPWTEPGATLHLLGMRYGAVPVVHATGTFRDTVVDFDRPTLTGNGVLFDKFVDEALERALLRFAAYWKDPEARAAMRTSAMRHPYTRRRMASNYLDVYRAALDA